MNRIACTVSNTRIRDAAVGKRNPFLFSMVSKSSPMSLLWSKPPLEVEQIWIEGSSQRLFLAAWDPMLESSITTRSKACFPFPTQPSTDPLPTLDSPHLLSTLFKPLHWLSLASTTHLFESQGGQHNYCTCVSLPSTSGGFNTLGQCKSLALTQQSTQDWILSVSNTIVVINAGDVIPWEEYWNIEEGKWQISVYLFRPHSSRMKWIYFDNFVLQLYKQDSILLIRVSIWWNWKFLSLIISLWRGAKF